MIQQSINQLLTLGAVGAKFSQSEKMKEVEKLKEQGELQTNLATQAKLKTANTPEEEEEILAQGEETLTRKKMLDAELFDQTIPGLNKQIKSNRQYIAEQAFKEAKTKNPEMPFYKSLFNNYKSVYRPSNDVQMSSKPNTFAPEDANQSFQQKGMQQVSQNVAFRQWADDLRARKQISHSTYEQIKEAIKNDERK